MVVISLETKPNKPKELLDKLNPVSDKFVNAVTDKFNKYLNNLLSDKDTTWEQLLTKLDVKQVTPLLFNELKQLWTSGWNLGSEHGRADIADVVTKIKRTNFAEQLELITFAKNNDTQIQRLQKQINTLINQQEDNLNKINQLNRDIGNPDRYAKTNLSKSSLTNDERQTVINVLTDQANTLQQQNQQLKQQQDALVYQLTKIASGNTSNQPKQLDMLSPEEVNQIKAQQKADKSASRKSIAQQKAEQRQQDLLTPIDPNSSMISQAVADLRNQRIRESEINRDVSNRLKKPITLSDETQFAQYLDKRYNDLARTLSKDAVDNTLSNVRQYISNLSNTKSKISNYLSSTKTSRERDLLRALSSMYPDYGKEARKIIKETKSQLYSASQLRAKKELGQDISKLNQSVQLNADQARRLGFGNKATKISTADLNNLAKKKSTVPRLFRLATTELTAAYNYGRFAHYEQDGIELLKWNVSLEHLRMRAASRSSNYSGQGVVCKKCLNLSERNIGFGPGVYPLRLFQTNQMLPPPNPHPNCACYLEPYDGKDNKSPLPVGALGKAAVLSGATIASIALLNSMFNKTRSTVKPLSIYQAIENISQPILQQLQTGELPELIGEASDIYEFVNLIHENNQRIKLQAPPIVSDSINLANEEDRVLANQALENLEEPIKEIKSKYDTTATISARNTKVLQQASSAIGRDIGVLNKAQALVNQSETIRQQFQSQFEAASGNSRLQASLLTKYTAYISDINKTIDNLDVGQIKLINALNTTRTALEETQDAMRRYQIAEDISPGIVSTNTLVNNTNTVRRLTDQANTVYNNILDTQTTRQTYKDTLNTIKDSLLNNTDVANTYLQQKARELNFVDTIFEDTVGVSNLSTNLDTAQEYVNAVKQRITNQSSTTPVIYDQSMRDLLAAQEELNKVRNATSTVNLDLNLLSKATQNPTITINGQSNELPFSQDQVVRVKSKFDTLSNLEAETNNLQAELAQLKNNSPKAKDQPTLNARGLDKPSRLNELTRQMGSLIYEQQGLLSTNPRYQEINNQLQQLNQQKQQIETAYFKRSNLGTLSISSKKRITVNGY